MFTHKVATALFVAVGLLVTGCTHTQLRRNTVHQGMTVSDIYTQQVLDNLARFVSGPNSLPSFAFPDEGSNEVGDKAEVGVGLEWLAAGFEKIGLDLGAEREMSQSWTMSPISDPRKLELMRCAYQRAVASCCVGDASANCPNCEKRWASFYLGTEETKETVTEPPEPIQGPHENEVEFEKRKKSFEEWDRLPTLKDSAIVTSECLHAPCWFRYGCKKCIPKHCCTPVGHYCGVYVWVEPGFGRDELSKLTLAILDYAVNDPVAEREKEIEVYLNDAGNFTAFGSMEYSQTFRATVPIDLGQNEIKRLLKFEEVGKGATPLAARGAEARVERLKRLPPTRSREPSSRLQLQQRFRPVQ